MMKLGVNIDHVATIREARRITSPDPVEAARVCLAAGCDSIVCHLREDRRHIKDGDVWRLREIVKTRLNLEMSIAKEIVDIACKVRPDQATLVPEKRRELTTEGGLDVVKWRNRISAVIERFNEKKIETSLFINPSRTQIDASKRASGGIIELHTGEYANALTQSARLKELDKIKRAVEYAVSIGLEVNAGHGLNYSNVSDIAGIEGINDLNIGHAIIARAVIVGMRQAVEE
ncbi:MAG: pyridoxine 5'-phosphate synthase, partial [Candidatus Omnitrophota bacterium]|nr:pyridoxine 5'-phosphate synthase [Candidatus Omnitrophota bacterium]